MLDTEDKASIIEAILFVSHDPLSAGEIAGFCGGRIPVEEVEPAITVLSERYKSTGSALQIQRVAEGFRIATRPEFSSFLKEFLKQRYARRLSRAALETLAVIAYRQPITTAEIKEIRNCDSSGTLTTLLEKRLIRICGKKNVVGHPLLYATTKEFLDHFNLNSLDDLPSIKEMDEVLGESPSLFAGGSVNNALTTSSE